MQFALKFIKGLWGGNTNEILVRLISLFFFLNFFIRMSNDHFVITQVQEQRIKNIEANLPHRNGTLEIQSKFQKIQMKSDNIKMHVLTALELVVGM